MTANFQETLKALGKQAKKEAAEREAEAKAKSRRKMWISARRLARLRR